MATPNTHLGAQQIDRCLSDAPKCPTPGLFFIGIGGSMMASLARMTHQAGFRVAGSDRADTPVTRSLRQEGLTVYDSHRADHLDAFPNCALVVYTVAITPDNPEYLRAAELGIPTVSRADYLGYLMTRYQNRIGVAGMHGKSTCTAMCAQIFMTAKANPTVLSGADYAPMGGSYRVGGPTHFLFEACEYMDSFLDFYPTIAILLNLEMEHVDYFKSMEQIEASFAAFGLRTGSEGTVVYYKDDPNLASVVAEIRQKCPSMRLLSFSTRDPQADVYGRIENAPAAAEGAAGCPAFTLFCKEAPQGLPIRLSTPGVHQVYNALAAATAALACAIAPKDVACGLEAFCGVARRMERLGCCQGAVLYDDYAHHPTEIRATLKGAAQLVGQGGRLFCIFQPHTYSRTHTLFQKFQSAFDAADQVWITDIYAARETNTYGVTSQQLAEALGSRAVFCPDADEAWAQVCPLLRPGDVMVIMGAGTIGALSRRLREQWRELHP